MDHSLINPNQIRHFGIAVSDDPYDSTQSLGIDHDDLFIPFMTEGCTVFFETFVPSDEELESCQHIVLTDGEIKWNPSDVQMSHNRPYGDIASVRIEAVWRENRKRKHVPVEYESDLVLGSISGSFVADDAYKHLVSTVQVTYPRSKRKDDTKKVARKGPRTLQKVVANTRHSTITPELLVRMHGIGLDKAKQMLAATTQKGVRAATHPINRRYRVNHLNLHANHLKGKWLVDWMTSKTKSISQCTGAFVYTNGHFTEVYLKENNKSSSASTTLNDFCNDVGTPEKLKSDQAPEFCGRDSKFLKNAKKKGIDLTYSEPERKGQTWRVDLAIRELKKRWHHKRKVKSVPRRMWDFGLRYTAKIMQLLP